MKNPLVTVILSILIMILPFPLHFIGIIPIAFNDSGETYINMITLLIYTAFLLGLYLVYFRIIEFILTKISNKIQLNKKIYYAFSLILPIFFLCMYIIAYQPDSFLSKSYKIVSEKHYTATKQNSVSDIESKISQSKHIAEFTMKEYKDLTVNFYISQDEIISKLLYNDTYQYASYKKFTSEEFYYLLNYKNQLNLEIINSGSSNNTHKNFSSSNYFKYDNVEFVTIKRSTMEHIDEFSFIKIDENYYVNSFNWGLSHQDDKKYRDLIGRVWSNTDIMSTDFFVEYDGEKLYFKNLENPLILYMDGDFFELNNTPLIMLN